jgi:DUF438 domain-containing protein
MQNKLKQLRKQYKLATTDIDREIIKARAELIKRGFDTKRIKEDRELLENVKNLL